MASNNIDLLITAIDNATKTIGSVQKAVDGLSASCGDLETQLHVLGSSMEQSFRSIAASLNALTASMNKAQGAAAGAFNGVSRSANDANIAIQALQTVTNRFVTGFSSTFGAATGMVGQFGAAFGKLTNPVNWFIAAFEPVKGIIMQLWDILNPLNVLKTSFNLVTGAVSGIVSVAQKGFGIITSAIDGAANIAGFFFRAWRDVSLTLSSTIQIFKDLGAAVSWAFDFLTSGVRSSIGVAQQFEAKMNAVWSVAGGTKESLKGLADEALRVGAATTKSATDAADAAFVLAQTGASADQAKNALMGVVRAAEATGASVEMTAGLITSSIYTWQDSLGGVDAGFKKAEYMANLFAAAANNSAISMEDLNYTWKYAAPLAANLGVSMEELSATVAVLGNRNIKGSIAGTTLRQTIAALLAPTDKAKAILAKYGLSVEDVNIKTQGLAGVLKNLKAANMETSDQLSVFGRRAGPNLAMLINVGGDAIDEMKEKLVGMGDAAGDMAAKRMSGLAGQMEQLRGATESLQIVIGQTFTPSLATAVGVAANFLQSLANLTTVMDVFQNAASAANAVLVPFSAVLDLIYKALGPLQPIVASVSTEFSKLFKAWQDGMADLIYYLPEIPAFAEALDLLKSNVLGVITIFQGASKTFDSSKKSMLEAGYEAATYAVGLDNVNDQLGYLVLDAGQANYLLDSQRKSIIGINQVTSDLLPTMGNLLKQVRSTFDTLRDNVWAQAFADGASEVNKAISEFQGSFAQAASVVVKGVAQLVQAFGEYVVSGKAANDLTALLLATSNGLSTVMNTVATLLTDAGKRMGDSATYAETLHAAVQTLATAIESGFNMASGAIKFTYTLFIEFMNAVQPLVGPVTTALGSLTQVFKDIYAGVLNLVELVPPLIKTLTGQMTTLNFAALLVQPLAKGIAYIRDMGREAAVAITKFFQNIKADQVAADIRNFISNVMALFKGSLATATAGSKNEFRTMFYTLFYFGQDFLAVITPQITSLVSSIYESIKMSFAARADTIGQYIGNVLSSIIQTAADIFGSMGLKLAEIVGAPFGQMLTATENAFGSWGNSFERLFKEVVAKVGPAINSFGIKFLGFVDSMWKVVLKTVNEFMGNNPVFGKDAKSLVDAIKEQNWEKLKSSIIDTVVGVCELAFNATWGIVYTVAKETLKAAWNSPGLALEIAGLIALAFGAIAGIAVVEQAIIGSIKYVIAGFVKNWALGWAATNISGAPTSAVIKSVEAARKGLEATNLGGKLSGLIGAAMGAAKTALTSGMAAWLPIIAKGGALVLAAYAGWKLGEKLAEWWSGETNEAFEKAQEAARKNAEENGKAFQEAIKKGFGEAAFVEYKQMIESGLDPSDAIHKIRQKYEQLAPIGREAGERWAKGLQESTGPVKIAKDALVTAGTFSSAESAENARNAAAAYMQAFGAELANGQSEINRGLEVGAEGIIAQSPPKSGPLSLIDKYGINAGREYVRGMATSLSQGKETVAAASNSIVDAMVVMGLEMERLAQQSGDKAMVAQGKAMKARADEMAQMIHNFPDQLTPDFSQQHARWMAEAASLMDGALKTIKDKKPEYIAAAQETGDQYARSLNNSIVEAQKAGNARLVAVLQDAKQAMKAAGTETAYEFKAPLMDMATYGATAGSNWVNAMVGEIRAGQVSLKDSVSLSVTQLREMAAKLQEEAAKSGNALAAEQSKQMLAAADQMTEDSKKIVKAYEQGLVTDLKPVQQGFVEGIKDMLDSGSTALIEGKEKASNYAKALSDAMRDGLSYDEAVEKARLAAENIGDELEKGLRQTADEIAVVAKEATDKVVENVGGMAAAINKQFSEAAAAMGDDADKIEQSLERVAASAEKAGTRTASGIDNASSAFGKGLDYAALAGAQTEKEVEKISKGIAKQAKANVDIFYASLDDAAYDSVTHSNLSIKAAVEGQFGYLDQATKDNIVYLEEAGKKYVAQLSKNSADIIVARERLRVAEEESVKAAGQGVDEAQREQLVKEVERAQDRLEVVSSEGAAIVDQINENADKEFAARSSEISRLSELSRKAWKEYEEKAGPPKTWGEVMGEDVIAGLNAIDADMNRQMLDSISEQTKQINDSYKLQQEMFAASIASSAKVATARWAKETSTEYSNAAKMVTNGIVKAAKDARDAAATELEADTTAIAPELAAKAAEAGAQYAKGLGEGFLERFTANEKKMVQDQLKSFIDETTAANPGQFEGFGEGIGRAFIDGMQSALGQGKEKLSKVFDEWKKLMESHSPPKEGPLQDIDKWGEALGRTFVDSVSDGLAKTKVTGLDKIAEKMTKESERKIPGVDLPITFDMNSGVMKGALDKVLTRIDDETKAYAATGAGGKNPAEIRGGRMTKSASEVGRSIGDMLNAAKRQKIQIKIDPKTLRKQIEDVFKQSFGGIPLPDLFSKGTGLGDELMGGIIAALGSNRGAFEKTLAEVFKPIEAHSPPSVGPLKNIDKWGLSIGDSFSSSVASGLMAGGEITDAMRVIGKSMLVGTGDTAKKQAKDEGKALKASQKYALASYKLDSGGLKIKEDSINAAVLTGQSKLQTNNKGDEESRLRNIGSMAEEVGKTIGRAVSEAQKEGETFTLDASKIKRQIVDALKAAFGENISIPDIFSTGSGLADELLRGAISGLGAAKSLWATQVANMFNAGAMGQNVGAEFQNGVGEGMKGIDLAADITDAFRMMESHSPPKEGPLTKIYDWGKGIVNSWTEGMVDGFDSNGSVTIKSIKKYADGFTKTASYMTDAEREALGFGKIGGYLSKIGEKTEKDYTKYAGMDETVAKAATNSDEVAGSIKTSYAAFGSSLENVRKWEEESSAAYNAARNAEDRIITPMVNGYKVGESYAAGSGPNPAYMSSRADYEKMMSERQISENTNELARLQRLSEEARVALNDKTQATSTWGGKSISATNAAVSKGRSLADQYGKGILRKEYFAGAIKSLMVETQGQVDWKAQGSNLIDNFIAGVRARLGEVDPGVLAALKRFALPITSSSPPKVGPLKNIGKWGLSVGGVYAENFARGISAQGIVSAAEDIAGRVEGMSIGQRGAGKVDTNSRPSFATIPESSGVLTGGYGNGVSVTFGDVTINNKQDEKEFIRNVRDAVIEGTRERSRVSRRKPSVRRV